MKRKGKKKSTMSPGLITYVAAGGKSDCIYIYIYINISQNLKNLNETSQMTISKQV